jgi:hypothetical protein
VNITQFESEYVFYARSPFLFTLYAERIMRRAELEEMNKGTRRRLNNLRYADDTTLLAGRKGDLADLIKKTEERK